MKRITAPRTGLAARSPPRPWPPHPRRLPPRPFGRSRHAAGLSTVTLTMNGSSIKLSGSPVAGAVNVDSVVKSPKGASPTLVHLNPGVSFAKAFGASPRLTATPTR